MMDVEIPKWLDDLPFAPEFRPTDTEFADPIAYISKIEKEASLFGICKIIPPFPKPSKKYVLHNLNKSLARCPDMGDDVCSSSKPNNGDKANDGFQAVFTTRQQELGYNRKKNKVAAPTPQLPAHKQVWQSGEIYTLEQFESKSKIFARSHLGMVKEVSPLAIETLFWKAACEKPIYIEYANDVPGSGFGEPEGVLRFSHRHRKRRRKTFNRNSQVSSHTKKDELDNARTCNEKKGESDCSVNPTLESTNRSTGMANALFEQSGCLPSKNGLGSSKEMEGTSGWKLSNSSWNLQVIARSHGSLTRFMPDDIPGVTSPMVYIGMLFSWFAWHVEDHELHSLNFLHMGSPKTWYAVPGDYALSFEEVIRTKAYGGDVDRFAALTLLGEKTTLLSPEVIIASGIPCCRLVQNPGEFVVTFPRAYHVGFSHGFNCGEAANFGTPKWLTLAKQAAIRRAAMNHLPMLSHQQLLYLLTMSFISRVPRSLLPGVRSSRLRDRQKEERELLVKKAFVEDMLNENKLLTSLLHNSPYHAVLWNLELLPSSSKESNMIGRTEIPKPIESCHSQQDYMSLSVGNVYDLYMDDVNDDDLPGEFQVDSGALPCVACGVLGFPFMSVLQPSEKASIEIVPANHYVKIPKPGESHFSSNLNVSCEDFISVGLGSCGKETHDKVCSAQLNGSSSSSLPVQSTDAETQSLVSSLSQACEFSSVMSGSNLEEGWTTSSKFLSPRIFCLEHASQTEELLRPKGGAKVLVICHSDFQKIKAHAAAVAEQIGSPFNYNEIPIENASQEDLNLINIAIEVEQSDECAVDWTSELNINMRQCVKLRNNSSSEKVQHALNLDALFSGTASLTASIKNLKWENKRSRSGRNLSHPDCRNTSKSILVEKKSAPEATSKHTVSIQYARKRFKFKPCSLDSVVENVEEQMLKDRALDELPGQNEVEVSEPICKRSATSYSDSAVSSAFADHRNDDNEMEKEHIVEEINVIKETCDLVANDDVSTPCVSKEGFRDTDNENEPFSSSPLAQSTFLSREESSRILKEACADKCGTSPNKRKMHSTFLKVYVRSASRKRRREAELLSREHSVVDGFIKSPCEGLRPRGGKEIVRNAIDQPAKKKPKKPSNSSFFLKGKKLNKRGSHSCDKEGCRLSFQTKEELLMHKRNKCPHNGCGKRFRAHKYACNHARVHEDDRPLKCSWEGCKMSFKWAWARTEHYRLHTGERPYKCMFEGCGSTFRYVSDYSRHRRKTQHYVN